MYNKANSNSTVWSLELCTNLIKLLKKYILKTFLVKNLLRNCFKVKKKGLSLSN